MNRRRLLKQLLALPVATAVGGCGFFHPKQSPIKSLKILLQGPFAVLIQQNQKYRIKAYVPHDDKYIHEFRYRDPSRNPLGEDKGQNSYEFSLGNDGLEISEESPYIDHGFDDFNPTISRYYPPEKAFVSLDLPAPDLISYIPPAEPVRFNDGTYGKLPLNHVLEYRVKDVSKVKMEYRVKDGSKVKMHSRDLPGFSGPTTCDDLYKNYKAYWKTEKEGLDEGRHLDDMLARCSQSKVATYFFGVGLPYTSDPEHALTFFNTKLLPILYGQDVIKNPPPNSLVEIKPAPCGQQRSTGAMPMLMPAVYRPAVATPRLFMASSTQDCNAPAVTATVQ